MDKINDFWRKHKVLVMILLAAALLGVVGLKVYMKYNESHIETVSHVELLKMIEEKQVEGIEYSPKKEMMSVILVDGRELKSPYPAYEEFKKDMLSTGIDVKKKGGLPENTFITLLEIGVASMYIFFILYTTKSLGNISTKDIIQESDVKFDQVVGLDEIMDDISLYVEMIKNPHIGDEIGAKLPKGVLLAGEPGTGKTLIAKAIAGEAEVPFISVSGSEFIEMYKGVGAKRVRKVFSVARKNAPCVVFIDEIDALGGRRDSDDMDSEDTQTLNQLLKEMDGFKSLDGVFILAATNCPENLDEALKRSGRFDRQVNIMPPKDWKVRKKLLDLYLEDYKVSEDVDTDALAKTIAGFTGADIAMICNESSIVAISKKLNEINRECIEEAIDKKIFKGNRAKSKQFAKDREIVAYHEAGHAVMKHILGQPIARASIVGTTSGVGGAVFGEDKDGFLRTSKDVRDNILTCYAGRASERIKFGEITTGAANDISKATEMILAYVMNYGFDEETGALDLALLKRQELLDESLSERVTILGKELEKEAEELLSKKYKLVEKLAKELLDKEIMSGLEVEKLLE